MNLVEPLTFGAVTFGYVLRADATVDRTTFVTPSHESLQLGLVVYPKGGVVPRHAHLPIERRLRGTAEVLQVRAGRCELDLFDDARTLVATVQLARDDVVLLVAGGHGIRFLEDTVLLEVKQGPYTGVSEKEHF